MAQRVVTKPQDEPDPRDVAAAGPPAAAEIARLAPFIGRARVRAAIEHLDEALRLLDSSTVRAGAEEHREKVRRLIAEVMRDIDQMNKQDQD